MPDANELLTVPEIAQELRVTEVTVRQWIRDGHLPALRAGRRNWRVRRFDLERWMAANSAVHPPTPAGPVALEDLTLHLHVGPPDVR